MPHTEKGCSFTAFVVAKALLACTQSKKWQAQFTPQTKEIATCFVKTALKNLPYGYGWLLAKVFNNLPPSITMSILNRTLSAGFCQHIALRKLFIEQQVREAIAKGCQHVIQLGAGLDPLLLRLHSEYPEVQFIELDKGPTRNTKLQAINQFKMPLSKNLHFLECDLSDANWYKQLQGQNYFNKAEKSIVIVEGVTMYLLPKDVVSLLKTLKSEVLNHDSQLVISFCAPKDQDPSLAKVLLKKSDELYLFSIMVEDVPNFVYSNGFGIVGKALATDLQMQLKSMPQFEKTPLYSVSEHYYSCYPLADESAKIPDISTIPTCNFQLRT